MKKTCVKMGFVLAGMCILLSADKAMVQASEYVDINKQIQELVEEDTCEPVLVFTEEMGDAEYAEAEVAEGICISDNDMEVASTTGTYKPYDSATYELNYSISSQNMATITGYTGTAEGQLVIPDEINGAPVACIQHSAFKDCSGFVGELVLPDTISYIYPYAFYRCSGLTGDLKLPDSVIDIGAFAFYGCSGFDGTLTLPEGLNWIGNYAFAYCSGLKGDIILPNSLDCVKDSVFSQCTGFDGKLVIPDNIEYIGQLAFDSCTNITGELVLPQKLLVIGPGAFQRCAKLTGELQIPEGVTTVGTCAFSQCSGFTGDLIIPESVTSIGEAAFAACSGLNGQLVLPSGLTEIEDTVFYRCIGLTGTLNIPSGVTSIGDWAFQETAFTGELKFPASLTSIGGRAFKLCSGFTGDLSIPEGVTSIGDWAFFQCTGFDGKLSLPNTVETIGEVAFTECSGLTGDLILPESIVAMGEAVFQGCTGFDGKLVIPDTWNAIPAGTFAGCCNLSGELVIPKNLYVIGEDAFYFCEGFEGYLVLSENLVEVGDYAFFGCSGLENHIFIPNQFTAIGDNAFIVNISMEEMERLDNLTYLKLPSRQMLHAPKGSYAQEYAQEYGYPYMEWNVGDPVECYEGNINSELLSFKLQQAANGSYYFTGEIVVVEWVDGVSTVPKDTPIMTFKSTDGTETIEVFVTPTGTNTYYFDRFVEGLSEGKEYVFEIASGTVNNYSMNRSMNVSIATSPRMLSLENLGKIGEQKISYYQADNGEMRLFRRSSTYEGHINSELLKTELVKGPNGNYLSGEIVVVEWENGVSTVPFETPIMYFKSVDGKESIPVFVTATGTNTYYFDRSLGDIDTSKEYIFTIESGDELNVSPYKSMVVTTAAMKNKEGLLWESDTQYVRYRTDANSGQLRVYAVNK